MFFVGDARHKRRPPKGTRDQMTPKWKADVIAELERRGADASDPAWFGRARVELARQLGVDKSAIGKLLAPATPSKPEQTSSTLVPRISKILGVALPVLGTDAEIAELVGSLNERQRNLALELLREMASKKDS